MSEKSSSRREADPRLRQTTMQPLLSVSCKAEDSNVDNLSTSSVVFSSKLRSLYDSAKTATKVELMEEYHPGVYITFIALPHGKTGLKRVRFRYIFILNMFKFNFYLFILSSD